MLQNMMHVTRNVVVGVGLLVVGLVVGIILEQRSGARDLDEAADRAVDRVFRRAAERSVSREEESAGWITKAFAYEAYPSWSAAHPELACPTKLSELMSYAPALEMNDPWGNPYRMFCGKDLPPGAKGLAVVSAGEDGRFETPDDIASWK